MKQGYRKISEETLRKIKAWFKTYILWIGAAIVLVAAVVFVLSMLASAPAGSEETKDTEGEMVTDEATEELTEDPTGKPTEESTEVLTKAPTEEVTEVTTEAATEEPTEIPDERPTAESTEEPAEKPTEKPTEAPTEKPTEKPTEAPTQKPTEKPTEAPTEEPTEPETMYLPSLKSGVDYNGNGVDDYMDIMLGARQDAINHPTYDGSWWATGYPPENIGVCSDVIWRAFKYAGYCLKDMVDADILARREAYPLIERPEHQIDFRRVRNLRIFFEKYAVKLTMDIYAVDEWQPGDIVIFGNDRHIGIVSDVRDANGIPYIIHNGGQDDREENYLVQKDSQKVTGHYRWDASLIPGDVLKPWVE